MSSSSSFLIGRKTRQLEQAYLEELLLKTAMIWKMKSLKASNSFNPKLCGRVSNSPQHLIIFHRSFMDSGGGGGCRRRGQVWIHSTEDMTKVEHKQVTVSFLNATFPFSQALQCSLH